MLRITPGRDANGAPVLRLEGRIAGAWVDELARACDAAIEPGRPLVLAMAGVAFLDAEGARLIRRLAQRGVAVRDCSPFVRELLEGTCDDDEG